MYDPHTPLACDYRATFERISEHNALQAPAIQAFMGGLLAEAQTFQRRFREMLSIGEMAGVEWVGSRAGREMLLDVAVLCADMRGDLHNLPRNLSERDRAMAEDSV